MAGDHDQSHQVSGEVVPDPSRCADEVVDDDGVEPRHVERPLLAETTNVLIGVLVGSVVASPWGADSHRRRAWLGDGDDRQFHAEGVGPCCSNRRSTLGGVGSIDTCDEVVDFERWCRRLVFGIRVDDEGTGNDDRLTPTFDDVRAVDPINVPWESVPTHGLTCRPGRRRVERRGGRPARATSVSTLTWIRGSSGSVPSASAASARTRCRSKSEIATVTVWTVASNRAASARAVGSAPSARCDPSSGTRTVRKTGSGARWAEFVMWLPPGTGRGRRGRWSVPRRRPTARRGTTRRLQQVHQPEPVVVDEGDDAGDHDHGGDLDVEADQPTFRGSCWVVAMIPALARASTTGRSTSVATSFAATKTANAASSTINHSARTVAVASSAPASASIAIPTAPATRRRPPPLREIDPASGQGAQACQERHEQERRHHDRVRRTATITGVVVPQVIARVSGRRVPADGVSSRMHIATTTPVAPTTPTQRARSHAARSSRVPTASRSAASGLRSLPWSCQTNACSDWSPDVCLHRRLMSLVANDRREPKSRPPNREEQLIRSPSDADCSSTEWMRRSTPNKIAAHHLARSSILRGPACVLRQRTRSGAADEQRQRARSRRGASPR